MEFSLLKYQIDNTNYIEETSKYLIENLEDFYKSFNKKGSIYYDDEIEEESLQLLYRFCSLYYNDCFIPETTYERIINVFNVLLQNGLRSGTFNTKFLEIIIIVFVLSEKESVIYEELNRFYLEHINEGPYIRRYINIGLSNVYIKVGDYFLLNKKEIRNAIKWYRLYNRENIRASKRDERISISALESILYREEIDTKFLDGKIDQNIIRLYKECMLNEYDCNSTQLLVSKCDEYVDYVKDIIGKISIMEFRYIFVINYRIKEMCLIPNLFVYTNYSNVRINKELVLKMIYESHNIHLKKLNTILKLDKFDELLEYIKIIEYVISIKSKLKVKNSITTAYYTKFSNLYHMFPYKGIKENISKFSLMNIAYMNDPNEGKVINKFFFKNNKNNEYEKRKLINTPYVFLKCFTSKIDDIPMWEMYGDHAKGCCIVIKANKNNRKEWNNQNLDLYKICYIDNEVDYDPVENKYNENIIEDEIILLNEWLNKIKLIVNSISEKEIVNSILEDIRYLFKDKDYSHEDETRIIKNYDEYSEDFKYTNEDNPKLFVLFREKINIDEIIIGPKCNRPNEMVPFIKEEFSRLDGLKPKITISNVNYK